MIIYLPIPIQSVIYRASLVLKLYFFFLTNYILLTVQIYFSLLWSVKNLAYLFTFNSNCKRTIQTKFHFFCWGAEDSAATSNSLSQPTKPWDKSCVSHSITWAFGTKSHQSFICSKIEISFPSWNPIQSLCILQGSAATVSGLGAVHLSWLKQLDSSTSCWEDWWEHYICN